MQPTQLQSPQKLPSKQEQNSGLPFNDNGGEGNKTKGKALLITLFVILIFVVLSILGLAFLLARQNTFVNNQTSSSISSTLNSSSESSLSMEAVHEVIEFSSPIFTSARWTIEFSMPTTFTVAKSQPLGASVEQVNVISSDSKTEINMIPMLDSGRVDFPSQSPSSFYSQYFQEDIYRIKFEENSFIYTDSIQIQDSTLSGISGITKARVRVECNSDQPLECDEIIKTLNVSRVEI